MGSGWEKTAQAHECRYAAKDRSGLSWGSDENSRETTVTKGEPKKHGTSRDADFHAAYSGVLVGRVSAYPRSTPEDLHDERQGTYRCLSYKTL
jgi:hypothetical protein